MAIIDNTLAAQVPQYDAAAPLKLAAQLRAAETEQRSAQFKQIQTEIGSEARGLTAFVNTPEFPARWAETLDRMAAKGLVNPQLHQQWRNTPSPLLLKQMITQTEDPTLTFRKEEAQRDQKNTDTRFGLERQRIAIANEGAVDEADDRAKAAEKYGLKPGTQEYSSFVLGGKLPKANTTVSDQVRQRRAAAEEMGIKPGHPAYESYTLTGKMPREDAQPLTATDKKAILEADEGVLSARTAIEALQKATDLSSKAFEGPAAGGRGYAASFLGESSDLGKGGIATAELNNVVMSNALGQLKAIFGGAPTEGERKILLDIQGSVNQPHAVRVKIYERAIEMAKNRLKFNEQRANELRGGQFYKPQGSARAPVAQTQGISEAEYAKLPSGSKFIAPDGSERVKP